MNNKQLIEKIQRIKIFIWQELSETELSVYNILLILSTVSADLFLEISSQTKVPEEVVIRDFSAILKRTLELTKKGGEA